MHEMMEMGTKLRNFLETWPRNFIQDNDLKGILDITDDARYALVKRALKSGLLIRVKKGLYLISSKTKQSLPDEFVLASLIYKPSIVSLESALSYHGWIPEAVYSTTCITSKRAQEFKTPIGIFSYKRVPASSFYSGSRRIATQTGVFLIADPWRALADFIYVRRKSWKSLAQLEADLRIDRDTIKNSDVHLLEELAHSYPSLRVRKVLKVFLLKMTKK